jgi:hypothetical protein
MIVEQNDPADAVNLLLVARKLGGAAQEIAADASEVAQAHALLIQYAKTRARNLAALGQVAQTLAALKPRRVALWGAGRLFDLLVREGGFDPARLSLLIDAHLAKHMDNRFGVALSGPEALNDNAADVVVVMSRMFAGEIAAEIRRRAPHAQIIVNADLLEQARGQRAA